MAAIWIFLGAIIALAVGITVGPRLWPWLIAAWLIVVAVLYFTAHLQWP